MEAAPTVSCPTCGGPANAVEGKAERWCNCLAWFAVGDSLPVSSPGSAAQPGDPLPVSSQGRDAQPGAPIAGFQPGRVAEAEGPGGAMAALGVFFWLLDGLFIALGIVAILAGWTKVGIALIVFGFFGGLFMIF